MMSALENIVETDKKERERRIIDAARRHSTIFPSGELRADECPDWLIPSASLGIEITELLPPKPLGANFSGPQISSFQREVVSAAEQHYYAADDARPADVLVFWRNEWIRKRDVKEMAQRLANIVRQNYPCGDKDCITWQSTSSGVKGWVNDLSVVRVLRGEGEWQAGGVGGIEWLMRDQVTERIAAKEILLSRYRARWPGWQIWLVLSTRMTVLHSVLIPRDIGEWNFNTGFDKVILCPWDGAPSPLHTRSL
jgi:hypothetical protein